ncbi:M81 family metallopeptidase [candidate division KSB1 bacterium]|nr:M81 family metallopeptidase [candidate division KSB1 bacterium]MBL7092718.1 M81 family metallopeptidase [candidate division KSB1 bacterium]
MSSKKRNFEFWWKEKALFKFFLFITFLISVIIFSCQDGVKKDKPIRIAVASFSHETCTFCPRPTTIKDWEFFGKPTKDFLDSDRDYIGGFKTMCEEFGGIELVPLTSPRSSRGGSSGSWNTQEVFDKYTNIFCEELKNAGTLDGVFLSLHGAMAVTGIPKPEAEIVRKVRKVVGDIPIMVTLDLHGNVDHELSDAADAVFIVKRYPHYDTTLQGERCARVMINTIRGNYKPTMATRKPGIITPSVFQGTGVSPAMDIMERARRWECRIKDVYVSVAFGFAYADVPDVGATVMVVTNNDQELADKIANDMSDYIWRVRKEFAGKKLPKTREGVALAIKAVKDGKIPVVIADHSDRTGGSSQILEELISQVAKDFCITTLRDEKAIQKILANHKVGDKISIDVGGYSDKFAGNPVHIEGKITFIGEYRRDASVVIKFGENNFVILTEHLMQITDTNIFKPLGINLESLEIIVLKSRVHFRRGYHETGFAGAIIEVDAPGWGPADLATLDYKNIPRDIYPVYRND